MLANERLLDIEIKFAAVVQRIVLLEAEEETCLEDVVDFIGRNK